MPTRETRIVHPCRCITDLFQSEAGQGGGYGPEGKVGFTGPVLHQTLERGQMRRARRKMGESLGHNSEPTHTKPFMKGPELVWNGPHYNP